MTVQVAAGVAETVAEHTDLFFEVRGGDRAQVRSVLGRFLAESDIFEMPDDSERFRVGEVIDRVFDVTELAEGVGFKVEFYEGASGPEDRQGLVGHLVAWLEDAEVGDVTLEVIASVYVEDPENEPVEGLGIGCVIGYLCGPPSPYSRQSSGPLNPENWIDAALSWATQLERVEISGMNVPRTWITPAEAVATVKANRTDYVTVRSEGSELSHVTEAKFWGPPANGSSVTFSQGGIEVSAAQRARCAWRLAELWANLDPLPVYASIGFYDTMDDTGRQPKNAQGDYLSDFHNVAGTHVPDVYWWQLLSAGHRDRLGGWPEDAQAIDDDHAVLRLGDPVAWTLPSARRDGVRAMARDLLADLLLANDDEAMDIRQARPDPPPEVVAAHRRGEKFTSATPIDET